MPSVEDLQPKYLTSVQRRSRPIARIIEEEIVNAAQEDDEELFKLCECVPPVTVRCGSMHAIWHNYPSILLFDSGHFATKQRCESVREKEGAHFTELTQLMRNQVIDAGQNPESWLALFFDGISPMLGAPIFSMEWSGTD